MSGPCLPPVICGVCWAGFPSWDAALEHLRVAHPRPVAVQPEASPPTATGADDPRLLKAEREVERARDAVKAAEAETVRVRRERDALRADLGRRDAALKEIASRCPVCIHLQPAGPPCPPLAPHASYVLRHMTQGWLEVQALARRALASETGGSPKESK